MSPDLPAVKLKSYHQAPEPGYMRHSAFYQLDPARNLDLEQLAGAARALINAGVPSNATIQVAYGNAIQAYWSVEDIHVP